MTQAAIVGIDYGHQFTKAIMVAPGIPFEIVFTDEGKRKDLSALSLKPLLKSKKVVDAERLYGSQIGSLCTRFPEACAANLKRLLGKSMEDDLVSEYLKNHLGVTLTTLESHDRISIRLGSGKHVSEFPVEEIAAMSLNNLKDRILKTLDSTPDAQARAEDVAVAVGSYASQLTRLAYLDTLELAEYSSVLGLVDEGTAVAIAFALNHKLTDEQYDGQTLHYVVYDVGAGSTSATLFAYTPFENRTVELNIESVGYDESFGGELLTTEVYNLMFEKVCDQFNFDKTQALAPRLASRLRETAEKAKIILSANSEYRTTLESFYDDKDFKFTLTREEFENSLSGLFERSTQPILDALVNSSGEKISISNIHAVILNGGSSRTPFIQKQLVSLLGSEDKIAKVVNTDEACALGTAIQAYNWKTISRTSPIIVKDRIFKNFQASVGGSGELITVFEKGSFSGNESVVSLGPLADEVDITLFEDGTPFASFNISGLLQKSKSMKCKAEKRELFGTFTIDRSKLYTLSKVVIKCSEEDDESLVANDNSTASNSTLTKRATVNVPLPVKNFTSLRPLNRSEKIKISKQLTELKLRDLEKVKFEEAKNVLESSCYSLRNIIEDNRAILSTEIKEETLEALSELASEVVEWLEFDADDFKIDAIDEKAKMIAAHKNDVEKVIRMQHVDLSQEKVQELFKQSNEIASQVQKLLLDFGQQVNAVREKYKADSLDFNKENEKVMRMIYGKDKMKAVKIDELFSSLKLNLKDLSALVDLSKKEYESLERKAIFELAETNLYLIDEMLEEIGTLQSNHQRRLEYLLTQYDKIKDRNAQKELKRKLKEEKESEEAQAHVEDDGGDHNDHFEVDVDVEDASSESVETPTKKSEEAVETAVEEEDTLKHDEL